MFPDRTAWLTASSILMLAFWTRTACSLALDETKSPHGSESEQLYKELLEGASRNPVDLTDYTKGEKIEEGLRIASVRFFQRLFGVKAEAGYMTVNSRQSRRLYFIHIRSQEPADKAPLLLWLPGSEPGERSGDSSSLFTLFLENGPVGIDKAGYFYKRKHTLQTTFNVLYLDALAGTGYSTAGSKPGCPKTMDEMIQDILKFLKKFLKLFPQYRDTKFYIGGHRYGVRTAVRLGQKFVTTVTTGEETPKLLLAGVICGSGLFAPLHQQRDISELGILKQLIQTNDIEEKDKTEVLKLYQNAADLANKGQYQKAIETIEQAFQKLGSASEFSPYTYFGNINQHKEPDQFRLFSLLVNSSDFKRLMHVGADTTFQTIDYGRFPFLLQHYFETISSTVAAILEKARLLVYVGDLDETFAASATKTFFENLEWTQRDELKRILGLHDPYFTRRMLNVTYKLLKDAGHYPGFDNSAATNELIRDFTTDKPFKINGVQ